MNLLPIKYYTYVLSLLAFILPLHPRFVPPVIVLVALLSFFSAFSLRHFFNNRVALSLVTLYFLYFVGMVYTENTKAGWFDLQVKLSLVVLPFALLPVFSLSSKQVAFTRMFFIAGCLLALCICFHEAFWKYTYEKWAESQSLYSDHYGYNFFLSSRLSAFIHPSYFSMYLGFAAGILFFLPPGFLDRYYLRWPLILIFSVSILLLASKAGFIAIMSIGIIYLVKQRSWKLTLVLVGGFVSAFVTFFVLFPEFSARFIHASPAQAGMNEIESSTARMLAWESALQCIGRQPLVGYGTGDAKEILLEQYATNGYKGLLEKELNAHNQFLQTTLALGIPGLAALLYVFIAAFKNFRKKSSFIGLLLLLLLVINFFVESMLETQAGVVFFAFWLLFEAYQQPAKISPVE